MARRKGLVAWLILSALFASSASAQKSVAQPAGRPIVVLLAASVWTGGSDYPLFVLYDDGTVLYRSLKEHESSHGYRIAKIGMQDKVRAMASFGIDSAFFELKPLYDLAPQVTDQGNLYLFAWNGDSLVRVRVRAGLKDDDTFREGIPRAFRDAFFALTRFRAAEATFWKPSDLIVAAWPYEYAPDDPPLQWPTKWSDFRSSGGECHADAVVKQMCTFQMDASLRQAVQVFLTKRREKQAILIGGKKMAVGYRVIIPGDTLWRRAVSVD